MASPLPNEWHLRTVAESSAKACYVCYKPTTRVLITPDNKVRGRLELKYKLYGFSHCLFLQISFLEVTSLCQDFFYVCVGHLSDRGFASPLVDPKVEAEKEREEAKKREIEKVIKEYEEKQHKKKEMKKAKKDGDEKDGGKDKKEEDDDQKAKNERDEKVSFAIT